MFAFSPHLSPLFSPSLQEESKSALLLKKVLGHAIEATSFWGVLHDYQPSRIFSKLPAVRF